MSEFPRLSNREWDVLKLVLEGKSNKMIAFSLGISERTVEFHLTNIYAKFRVNSRIELILKLGNAAGGFAVEKPGISTVAPRGNLAENRTKFNLQMGWAEFFRESVSIIGKEISMKTLLKHVLAGSTAALFTGVLLISVLLYTQSLLLYEVRPWIVPLISVWVVMGLLIGLIGARWRQTPRRVFFSAVLGTGAGFFTIMPLMWSVVIPMGHLAKRMGIIDPSTMPGDVANNWAAILMLVIWFVTGSVIGSALLFLRLRKLEQAVAQA